ncbi:MAG: DUF2304 family protein [Methanobacterium sp.]
MVLPIYSIIGTIIGLIAIILAFLRFREGKMTMGMLILWIVIWVGVIIVSINPESTVLLTAISGIERGLDVVLILGLVVAYYLIFRIYTMMESMEKEITLLVRELALQRGEKRSEDDQSISDEK